MTARRNIGGGVAIIELDEHGQPDELHVVESAASGARMSGATAFPTFDENASAIAEHGYDVLPVHRCQKNPLPSNWTNYRFADPDMREYRGAGIAILTKRTPAIDMDVRDEACAAEIAAVIESEIGPAPRRIGQAPKAAWLCQLEGAPFSKIQTQGYRFPDDKLVDKLHKVEILADGQQLVAYNLHPDTRRPYEWNGQGEPLTVPWGLLPPLTAERARALIAKLEKILARYGIPGGRLTQADDERPREPNEQQRAADPAQFRAALAFIRNTDTLDYDDWIRVGHAIKGALGEAGREDFLAWSEQSAKNQPDVSAERWNSFEPTRIGAGSIYYLAAQAGWRSGKPAGATWTPPAVTSYGEAFDPAAIPLRQWLVRGRYARGEGTAIAGPPGTNKSTLLLTDAVQLATAKSLLGDQIEQGGAVLFLVGEDRRRDFEARLAAICEHYHIPPRELGYRLRVVYQSEINPADYTLGEMINDVAALNTRMFEWLRASPDLVALFIDPMLSWHRLIENDNAAMQLLCVALRGLATQANIAVAFDHHVTKLSMYDLEAHVGNLAAMRGASSIAADMRWAFTMARLKPETAQQFGIAEEDRKVYRRLDTLKASYGPDDDAPRLFKIESVLIANGEYVGVLTSVDGERLRADGRERAQEAKQEWRDRLADALARMLREKAPRSASEAALWIATREPQLFLDQKKRTPLSDKSVYRKLPAEIGAGLDVGSNDKPSRIVVRESGSGRGARCEIDFEQRTLK